MGWIVGGKSMRGRIVVCIALFLCTLADKCTASFNEDNSKSYKSYEGYSLISSIPDTVDHLNALQDLADQDLPEVQFWKRPSAVLQRVDILVSPALKHDVISILDQHNISYVSNDNHVHRLLEQHKRVRRSQPNNESTAEFSLDMYHTYDEISDWLDRRSRDCGQLCEVITIGQTFEGRHLKLMKIGRRVNKPVIWIDGGMHAREWIAPATTLYIINKLLDVDDPDSDFLLNRYSFYVLPLVNADGYSYTWTADRMWRKTRSINVYSSSCPGVDPNRNWGYKWGGPGASKNPCSESFRGPGPFSEPETRAMSSFILNLTRSHNVLIYLSLHSYGQYFLTPWGYSSAVPADYDELMSVARQATRDIYRVHRSYYLYGSSGRLLYAAAGGSDDWAKGVAGIKYSYTVELRDKGEFSHLFHPSHSSPVNSTGTTYGFLLPPDQIRPTCEELFAGLQSVARTVNRARRRRLRALEKRRRH